MTLYGIRQKDGTLKQRYRTWAGHYGVAVYATKERADMMRDRRKGEVVVKVRVVEEDA